MTVENIGLTQPWNEGTESADAEIAEDGAFQNTDLREEVDNFDGSVIDSALWSEDTNGAGTVTLQPDVEGVLLTSGSISAAAMLISKAVFDFTAEWRIQNGVLPNPRGATSVDSFYLFRSATEPTVMNNAALTADRVISAGGNTVTYKDNVGAFVFFNGSIWTSSGNISYIVSRVVLRSFDDSGTMKWQLLLYDLDSVLQDTTPAVAWSATRTPGGGEDLWFFSGSPRTDVDIKSNYILNWQRWGEPDGLNYSTSAQTVETDAYTTSEEFDSDDITIQLGRTPASAGEIQVAVNVDGGGFGSFINVNVTPIAGETGWFKFAAGTTFSPSTSVVLKPQINSPDSDIQLRILTMKINGVTVAGGGIAGRQII